MKTFLKGFLSMENLITLLSLAIMLYVFPDILGFKGVAWDACVILGSSAFHLISWMIFSPFKKVYSSSEKFQQEVFSCLISFSINLVIITVMLMLFAFSGKVDNMGYIPFIFLFSFPTFYSFLKLIITIRSSQWTKSPSKRGAFAFLNFIFFLQELFLYSSFWFIFMKKQLKLFLKINQLLFSFKI